MKEINWEVRSLRYNLKPGLRVADFLQAVNLCTGRMLYETANGDVLDLKSELSRYVFLALNIDGRKAADGRICCSPQDAALLTEYIVH